MNNRKALARAVAVSMVAALLALVPAGTANADPVPGQGASLAAIYPCQVRWIDNREMGNGFYARPDPPGPYSWTWTEVTRYNDRGPRVIEVQCLLWWAVPVFGAAADPGPIDGIFGPRTEAGVKQAQRFCLGPNSPRVNGIVDADTWHCLRRLWV
jgi:peptidoglycan hydrolase-like protein with peptidoglycan-binding domain